MRASTPGARPAAAHERARPEERGTALVLLPAMVLVLLSLGAIAIDLSLVHSVHRDAHRVASAAADDAAAMIDERQLQITGALVIDPAEAERVVRAHLSGTRLAGDLVDVEVQPSDTTVDVRLTVDAPHVLLASFPGRADSTRLVVVSRGRLHA